MLSVEHRNLTGTWSQLFADIFKIMWDAVLDIKSSKAFFLFLLFFSYGAQFSGCQGRLQKKLFKVFSNNLVDKLTTQKRVAQFYSVETGIFFCLLALVHGHLVAQQNNLHKCL